MYDLKMAYRHRRTHSFAEAVFRGDINGPQFDVYDSNLGRTVGHGDQAFGGIQDGRSVIDKAGSFIGRVIDCQHPADTPQEFRDPEVAYSIAEVAAEQYLLMHGANR
jgi:hypothetical protein